LKEELIRIRVLKTAIIVPPVLSATGIIPNKLNEILKLIDLRPAVHIVMQEAVILNTCRIVRTFLAEEKKKRLISETGTLLTGCLTAL
jgi:hypothetical protein